MNITKLGIYLVIIYSFMACSKSTMKFIPFQEQTLKEIPGASGVAFQENKIYVIGDNAPYLFELNHQGKLLSKFQIHSLKDYHNNEIAKPLKPDFEAMELIQYQGKKELIIFGSGSKSPERDVFTRIYLKEPPELKTYNLTGFYSVLKELKLTKGYELNIEAVAMHADSLMLFNRGQNLIFKLDYSGFLHYLSNEKKLPEIEVIEIQLPHINQITAGFSGATIIPGTRTLLFTTTVENTPNAYDDGEVLGSFLGMVNLEELSDPGALKYALLKKNREAWKIKIESVAVVKSISPKQLEILLVSDSDGAESQLIRGTLSW
ncbi:DUF6929 family protein [Gillisia limnaea]|uniref:Lipoprotein n=1 Tax=Gillisia limnaea (strain DSM 15749 / LMG 21470 / R-8282) TaxID=865937 RepID=H2BS60_GILLR|nr:hypothetical protein [Gillisia limnaea]EHQ03586.1 hypothetical protein Gilli_2976 [Gillisia limnaea DSM 15749]